MLEPGSFDVHKNTGVLMIAMLGHLELNMEILDRSMETVEFNNCRELSRDDRNTNGVLAMI